MSSRNQGTAPHRAGRGVLEGTEKAAPPGPSLVYGVQPQQIANRLPIDFPDDESMRISHEAIYQALHIEGRSALQRELVACLRRALRVPRARSRNKPGGHFTAAVSRVRRLQVNARPERLNDVALQGLRVLGLSITSGFLATV